MKAIGLDEALQSGWAGCAAILCDLDGCLIAGDRALPGARRLVGACGSRLWIVSNNSTDTAVTLNRRLSALGLAIAANRIVLAGEETLRVLSMRHPGARTALYAAGPLLELADDLGLIRDDVDPEVAVLARDPEMTLSRLTRLAGHLHQGVPLYLTNPDPSHPGPDGTPVPETGALFAALTAIVPGITPWCLGKPDPGLVQVALERAGVGPDDAVYFGDTPETDGEAAHAAGVTFVRIARPSSALAPQSESVSC